MFKSIIGAFLATASLAAAPAGALAAKFPSQPIRLMVGYAPGGSVDIVARAFAKRMTSETGQSVVVENRGGASGTIAAQAVVNASPDGYTLYFVASPTVTITPAIRETGFDPLKDFTPVASIVNYTNVLMVNKDSPYQNVGDLIKDATARPGVLTYGSAGVGASNHLSGALLSDSAKVELTHVPYKGNAPALTDLIAGRITMVFDLNTTAANYVKGGQLKALAVTSAERNPMFPDVPTLMESGQNVEFTGWLGLLGPAALPDDVRDTLAKITRKILEDPEFKAEMQASGYTMADSTPEKLTERLAREGQMFHDVAARNNLRQD